MLPFQFHQSGDESDYSPVWFEMEGHPQNPATPFKFNSSWLKDESFQHLFKSNWIDIRDSEGNLEAIQFATNLKRIKKLAIPWAKSKQKPKEQELQSIEEQLRLFQEDLESRIITGFVQDNLKRLEAKRRLLLAEQEETWKLKNRAIWLENGDENTTFFQAYAKGRREENTIWSLKDQEGRSITSFEGLTNLVKNHFQTLFKEDRRVNIAKMIKVALYLPSFVSEQGNQDLFVEVTEAEVKETLLSFQKDKIHGPNGWTIECFRGFFDLIRTNLLKVIEESRINGRIHEPFNTNFLSLIPKSNDPQCFDNFRPISTCNCIYKIIAEIIARRLKPFVSKAISKEPFRFLEGLHIHEAIGVAQEVLHSLKNARTKAEILKIDLSKTYYRVSWDYIRLLLTHLGFEVPFIKWVMACISSVSFVVLIIGESSPFFISERGLSQGFPLSPLLFILAAEGLSKAIDTTTRAGNFQGIQVAPGMRITHLLLMDDVLIF
jgi:hypothetical protein